MNTKVITWLVVGVLVYWLFFKDSVQGRAGLSGGFTVGAGTPPSVMGNDGHWSQQGPSPSGNTWANSSPYPYYPPPNPPAVAYTPANQAPSTNAWDVLNTVVDQAGDYFNNN